MERNEAGSAGSVVAADGKKSGSISCLFSVDISQDLKLRFQIWR
jgi:hypothetical protein